MIFKRILKIFYLLAATIFTIYLLLTTHLGLLLTTALLKWVVPGTYRFHQIEGNWLSPIKITDFEYRSATLKFSAQEIKIDFDLFQLLSKTLKVSDLQISGGILSGSKWMLPFFGSGAFTITPQQIEGLHFSGALANLQFNLQQSLSDTKPIHWEIALEKPKYQLALQGVCAYDPKATAWFGSITKADFSSLFSGTWVLENPTPYHFSTAQFSMDALKLVHHEKTVATLLAHFSQTEGFALSVAIPKLPLEHPNFQGEASIALNIQQKPKALIEGVGTLSLSPGVLRFLNPENKLKNIPYLGGKADILLNNNLLSTSILLKENIHNQLDAKIKIPLEQGFSRFFEQPIAGTLTANFQNLTALYTVLPQLSRLKAALSVQGQFQGTVQSPALFITAETTKSSFYLLKQAAFVDNINIQCTGILPGTLDILGKGRSGTGHFQLTGDYTSIEKPLLFLEINGHDINIYNTNNIKLNVSPNITLALSKNILELNGTVSITKGDIIIQSDKNQIVISDDVIIIDPTATHLPTKRFNIIPHLYLITENRLHFKGYGLDGIVSGKLTINKRSDGLLSGHGRLTIKEGKYRLQGATRYIHHGYLLFPPGTLLNDPILDIRVLQKSTLSSESQADVGIYVQGTLQKPILSPFSNANLQNTEILSKLGFGNTQSPTTETERQLISQSAFLLAGTTNPFIEHLQENLGLEEFNLESREAHRTYTTQGATDTVLVIGKPLSTKLYLQYVQSVLDPISTIRLKYALTPHVTTSVETGTEGLGGDLIFSWERD